MQKTITKREYLLDAYGRTFSVTAYWGTSLRANVGVGAELVERPEWEAPEAEWKAWRKAQNAMARPLVEAALELVGAKGEPFAWSAKRLCHCGCSPAFILGHNLNMSLDIEELLGYKDLLGAKVLDALDRRVAGLPYDESRLVGL